MSLNASTFSRNNVGRGSRPNGAGGGGGRVVRMSLPDDGDDGDDVEEDVTSQTPSRRHKINTGSSAEETSSLVSGGTAGGASGVAVAGRSGRK